MKACTNGHLPRLGAVGLNYGAHALERHFAGGNEHFALGGVFDHDSTRTHSVAERFGVRAYGSWEEMLGDRSLAAVVLFTPPRGRADLIREALKAGKHVLATKPFEMNAEAAAAILEEAKSLGLALHSNSPASVWPADLAQIRQWQRERDLGKIVGAFGEVYGGYQEDADGSWLDDPQLCPGGPMFRLGIYLVNDLGLLLGPPVEVRTFETRVRTGRPTPDNTMLMLRYADGALATIYASLCVDDGDAYRNSLTLHFERGSVYRNTGAAANPRGHAVLSLILGTQAGRSSEETVTVRADPHNDYRWDWFAAAIRGEKLSSAVSAEEIVAGVEVVEMLGRAVRVSGQGAGGI